MSVATRRERKAERLKREGRPLAGSIDEVAVANARDTIAHAFDVRADMGLLDRDELTELVALCKRIRVVETAPAVAPAPREQVERYAAKAIELAEGSRGPNLKANAALLAERARSTGRIPSDGERRAILSNQDLGATLASLRLPSPPGDSEVISRGINLAALDEKERARLETLVEIAAGAEPGTIFEPRRKEQRFRTAMAEQLARLAPGPRKRRLIDEPGVVSLPKEVWEDVLRSDGNGVYLQAVDLAVLTTVLAIFETRKPPRLNQTSLGYPRLDDDDNTLVIRKGIGAAPWGPLGDLNGELGTIWPQSLKRLDHCKWLAVTDGAEYRIRRGPRLEAFLAKRQEVGS